MKSVSILCTNSRIENNRNFYACFKIGPFNLGQSTTIANTLRKSLLSELSGLAITEIEIKGITHEYSTLRGVRESVLDLILNIKQIVFTSDFQIDQPQFGYLQVCGPAVIKTNALKLPRQIQCVDPDQYIATLAYDGNLDIKFMICNGKNFSMSTPLQLNWPILNEENKIINRIKLENDSIISNKNQNQQKDNLANYQKIGEKKEKQCHVLPVDAVFMPVNKVNFLIELDTHSRQSQENIILEIWTNGSIHPRRAIHQAAKALLFLFYPLQKTISLSNLAQISSWARPFFQDSNQNSELKKTDSLPSILTQTKETKILETKKDKNFLSFKNIEIPFTVPNKKEKISSKNSIFEMDIGNLSLSSRTYLALKKRNIYTLNDLLKCSRAKLLQLKAIDNTALQNIEKALFELGFFFKKT